MGKKEKKKIATKLRETVKSDKVDNHTLPPKELSGSNNVRHSDGSLISCSFKLTDFSNDFAQTAESASGKLVLSLDWKEKEEKSLIKQLFRKSYSALVYIIAILVSETSSATLTWLLSLKQLLSLDWKNNWNINKDLLTKKIITWIQVHAKICTYIITTRCVQGPAFLTGFISNNWWSISKVWYCGKIFQWDGLIICIRHHIDAIRNPPIHTVAQRAEQLIKYPSLPLALTDKKIGWLTSA